LAKEKNWDTLLAAVAQVIEKRQDVRLVIIGDGDEQRALINHAKKLGIAERVEFTGKIPFADVPHYLKAADLFCFASVTETQGLVTMEALAAELPVVAVEATGTSDVIEHGRHGLLTDNDSTALAQAILSVLDDEALWQRFKEAATARAKDFDMLLQAEKLVAVYHQAIEDQQADHLVRVDKQKKIFQMIIDEEQWQKWLGLEKES
jgi:glycosyltransferase involved in cell wall biosynthesis